MRLSSEVESFFGRCAPVAPGDGLVVAFSGGSDSTALLRALLEVAPRLGLQIFAFHVDHGFDSGSAGRCAEAAAIARGLGAPFGAVRLEGETLRRRGEGVEEAARRLRYAALEEERLHRKARYVATAHHLDDQAETVALRLLLGSGIEGLAGTLPVRGAVIRPFLGVSRQAIAAAAGSAGPEPVSDPTNRDLRPLRNRLRHLVLPRLEGEEPGISARLAGLAERAGKARRRLEARLSALLDLEADPDDPGGGATAALAPLRSLPPPLLAPALALLHRRAGAPHPPGGAARAELERQLARPRGERPLGCDCGGGWRWEARGERLAVRPKAVAAPGSEIRFTYTLRVPGEIEIPEISARLQISPDAERSEPLPGAVVRVALALPAAAGDLVTLRNRLPGDRLRPLGAPGRRRLKEILIDRRIPRQERDRLPLLCWEGRIAWVPGVAIEHDFREVAGSGTWIAEITYL